MYEKRSGEPRKFERKKSEGKKFEGKKFEGKKFERKPFSNKPPFKKGIKKDFKKDEGEAEEIPALKRNFRRDDDKNGTRSARKSWCERERKESYGGGRDLTNAGKRVYTAEYKVNRSGELLDFLLAKCNTSRNNVKTFLSDKKVLVNGSVVTRYDFVLAKDDEVKISKYPIKAENVGGRVKTNAFNGGSAKGKKYEKDPLNGLKIIYEDEEFIAVDKPAGLLSVESDNETECAFGRVLEYLRAKNPHVRPFILHRIDKETSGVLVFAKDVKVHSALRLNWNSYVKLREYYAVAEGAPSEREGTIVSYLKENCNHLVYSTHDPAGQKAITHYKTERKNDKYSLLRVCIDTGRKNQIRVHMQELGCPVIGDDKYGCTQDPLGRLGLHASRLEFVHPFTGKIIAIAATLPPSFEKLFD